MKNDVRLSLSRLFGPGELTARFQPIVHLSENALLGFEILARWQQKGKREVLPSRFIPLLERDNNIDELTLVLLRQAFRLSESLPPTFGLSLNVSPLQLRSARLPGQIERLRHEYKFDLSRLTVEITESAYLSNLEQARSVLSKLKDVGVQLSLDDFGTGYSSLTQLHALPFDEVKIDRSFVNSMTTRRESRKIVAAVIGLGRSLGLATVGEGIEQPEQAEMLHCLGCERGQGWLFGRPLSGADVVNFLARQAPKDDLQKGSQDGIGAGRECIQALPTSSHAQLQAIYDGAPVGLCFLDCDFRYVSLNLYLAQMHNLPIRQHLGRSVQQVSLETHKVVCGYLERARNGEAVRNVEAEIPTADGPKTVLLSYQPAFDEAGEVIGISVVVSDISSRKETEERLRESEDHYRNMVEVNPQIPWILDQNGYVIEVSPRWHKFTGQTEKDAYGLGWLKALHPDDVERTTILLAEAFFARHAFTVEYRVKKEDGEWHWIRSRGAPKLGATGEVIRWYGSAECIDEQKSYEASLEEANFRLQEVLDALPIGVVIAEAPNGRILRRNPAAGQLVMQDPILFKSIEDYAKRVAYYKHGRRMQSDEFPLARAINHGEITHGLDVFCDLGDNQGRWLTLTGNPLRTKEGAIFGAVATIQEATLGKEAFSRVPDGLSSTKGTCNQ